MAAGDQHYLEMGKMAHQFALLENTVAVVICTALGDMNDQRFRAVTTELMWVPKLRLLNALVQIAETRDGPERANERQTEWKEFFSEAEDVAKDRNRLLHSPLMSENPGEYGEEVHAFGLSRSKRNRGGFESYAYTPANIRAVTDRIRKTHRILQNLTFSSAKSTPRDLSNDGS